MADLGNIADLKTAINSRVNNNTSQDITPTDVRSSIVDTVDTLDALKENLFIQFFQATIDGVLHNFKPNFIIGGKMSWVADEDATAVFFFDNSGAGFWKLDIGPSGVAVASDAGDEADPTAVPSWDLTGITLVVGPQVYGPTSQEAIEGLAANGTEKVWEGYTSQSSTDAPTIVTLVNTLGGTPVMSYDSNGTYYATLVGAFPSGKTSQFLGLIAPDGSVISDGYVLAIYRETDDALVFKSGAIGDVPADDLLGGAYFKITVKP